MAKIILAAGLVRDFEFSSEACLERYLKALGREYAWKELDRFVRADGSVVVRIVQQYGDADLIEL
ncbi:MAG: hypothetical protein E7461_00580 [Ruminococcaceae bacterium]|nr:hypothetical protein [Oscillospiraceae bacterium]